MSITTYSELQTAAANWLQRADLTSRIPEFISLAEAKLQRELKARDMEQKITSIAVDAEYKALPVDFLEVRYFEIESNPRQMLDFMPPETQTELYKCTSCPKTYSIVGSNFRFAPTPGTVYQSTLVYFAKIPALGTVNTQNWLLTAHPDVYLYGTLLEATAFLQNDPRIALWKGGYDEAVAKIKAQGDRGRWSGTAMATRAERVM